MNARKYIVANIGYLEFTEVIEEPMGLTESWMVHLTWSCACFSQRWKHINQSSLKEQNRWNEYINMVKGDLLEWLTGCDLASQNNILSVEKPRNW